MIEFLMQNFSASCVEHTWVSMIISIRWSFMSICAPTSVLYGTLKLLVISLNFKALLMFMIVVILTVFGLFSVFVLLLFCLDLFWLFLVFFTMKLIFPISLHVFLLSLSQLAPMPIMSPPWLDHQFCPSHLQSVPRQLHPLSAFLLFQCFEEHALSCSFPFSPCMVPPTPFLCSSYSWFSSPYCFFVFVSSGTGTLHSTS